MSGELVFKMGGTEYRTDRTCFEARLVPIEPVPASSKHKYFVRIGSRRYPAKQAVAGGLGAPLASFQSQQAFSILQRLGYEVETVL